MVQPKTKPLTSALFAAVLREDLHAFALKAFEIVNNGQAIEDNWHIQAITRQLTDVLEGKTKRLIINAPPRSLKSFLASVAFPAFALAQNQTRKLICVSYSEELANKHSTDARRLMESNLFSKLFKNFVLDKATEKELRTKQGGFRLAASLHGTLTGLGGDILIVDDPLNASDAFSDTTRRRANEWFSQTLVSRLDSKLTGSIVVIMQRLHQEDLTGYLLEKTGWKLLNLPAIALEDRDIPLWRGSHFWKKGEPLQAIREPLSVLQQMKAEIGGEAFNAQYLQDPVPAGGNMLKREWLREYQATPTPENTDMIVQSWDTALTANETSKYSVCLTFRVRNNNEYYLLDVFREKCEFPDLVKHVVRLAHYSRPGAILIENRASGISLIQTLRHTGLQGVIEIEPDKDKQTRMRGQTPKLESRALILPQASPWLDDFLTEYLAFPGGRYNDQVDALSQFLGWQSQRERTTRFEADWGYDDQPGMSSPTVDEMLWIRRR